MSPYNRPKYIRMLDFIPQTGNGKINRVECRALAEKLL